MKAPTVLIKCLDKPRKLCFSFNAIEAYLESTGLALRELQTQGIKVNHDAGSIKRLLWACLQDDDDSLTIKEVGQMIYPGNIDEVAKKLEELMEKSVPVSKVEKSKNPKRPASKTSKR